MKGTLELKKAEWKDRHPLPYFVVLQKKGEAAVTLTPAILKYEDADSVFGICVALLRALGATVNGDVNSIEWEL